MDDFTISDDQAIEALIAAGIFVGSIVLARLAAAVLRRVVHHYTHATETDLDDDVVGALRFPLLALIFVEGAFLALRTLSVLDDHRTTIERAWVALTMVLAIITAQRLLSVLLTWYGASIAQRTATDWDQKSLPMIRRVLNVALFAIGAMVILDQLGISISPLLAGLGIGGIAVALALQPLLSNVFASSYMLSDGSIRVDDFLEIEGGPTGWVEDIGFRATRIRTFDNNIIIIPNSTLAESTVTNFDAAGAPVDAAITCGVAYEEDLERVEEVCLEELRSIVNELDEAVGGEPIFRFQRFGDSNIDFLMKIRAVTRRQVGLVTHVMVKRIHARLNAEGITINYPARRLFLATEDTDGFERFSERSSEGGGGPGSLPLA
ncbi:MAG: mechanosensitive ion channel family protein [Dehalococcoidia bacterium]|jgi:MscS family membrane protein|nr:mechanosensitive ion channel family protein [Dehalococcoidia bacterium]